MPTRDETARWGEPYIQIGNYVLSEGQAMAVRVAITDFHAQVKTEEGRVYLGSIAEVYRARLEEVLRIIIKEGEGQVVNEPGTNEGRT